MNMKKAWETYEIGRAEKAMRTRQRFLDSLPIPVDNHPLSEVKDGSTHISEVPTDEEVINTTTPPIIEQEQVVKSIRTIQKTFPKDERTSSPPPSKPKITLPPLDLTSFLK